MVRPGRGKRNVRNRPLRGTACLCGPNLLRKPIRRDDGARGLSPCAARPIPRGQTSLRVPEYTVCLSARSMPAYSLCNACCGLQTPDEGNVTQ